MLITRETVHTFDYLHFILIGLCTNSFEDATPGDALPTSLLNAQGRLLFYHNCFVTEDAVQFICEPSTAPSLLQHFNKFIFPADKVSVRELATELVCLLDAENAPALPPSPGRRRCRPLPDGGILVPVALAGHDDLVAVSSSLSLGEAVSVSEWEQLRISFGRPSSASEINDKTTALETGLMATLHFNKGCFTGNEIVAKTVQTNAVRQRLVSLQLSPPPAVPHTMTNATIEDGAGEVVGRISSVGEVGRALGFVKTKYASGGSALRSGDCEVCVLPATVEGFPRFDTASSPSPPVAKVASKGREILVGLEAATGGMAKPAQSAEEARKAAKLAAMAQKVAELQAKKKNSAPPPS